MARMDRKGNSLAGHHAGIDANHAASFGEQRSAAAPAGDECRALDNDGILVGLDRRVIRGLANPADDAVGCREIQPLRMTKGRDRITPRGPVRGPSRSGLAAAGTLSSWTMARSRFLS